jgi:hypothetical protein
MTGKTLRLAWKFRFLGPAIKNASWLNVLHGDRVLLHALLPLVEGKVRN